MHEIKLILGVSGASGALYTSHFIRTLVTNISGKTNLIVSPSALRVYNQELQTDLNDIILYLEHILQNLSDNSLVKKINQNTFSINTKVKTEEIFHEIIHEIIIEDYKNIGAKPASGSAKFDGMVVLPCSMKSLASIANGITSNLIERAADVCLKERRKLILVPRETPYNQIHLENMLRLTKAGAVILPASPGFYLKPKTIDDLVKFVVDRVLSFFDIRERNFKGWEG